MTQWQLVPTEPTEDMLRAAMQYDAGQTPEDDPELAESIATDYRLMLGAAPTPSEITDERIWELWDAECQKHDALNTRHLIERFVRAVLAEGRKG